MRRANGSADRSAWTASSARQGRAAGFLCVISVHFWVGYTNPFHIAPAILGAAQFGVGITLSARRMLRPDGVVDREPSGLGQPSSYELQRR